MTDISDEEGRLRRHLVKKGALLDKVPEPPAVDKAITATVRQANVQTGGRDLLVLGVSSFFAFLLLLCAPIIAASAANKKRRSIEAMIDTDDTHSSNKH